MQSSTAHVIPFRFSSICGSGTLQIYSRTNDLFSNPYALDQLVSPHFFQRFNVEHL